ncbi:MAG: TolC family protein, partial [Desulfurobacteriaceae bacterium]
RISYRKGSLESAEKILKVAEEKYEKGLVMITDVLKAKSEVEKVRGELSSLEAEYDQSFNRLNELLNFSLKKGEKPEVELKEEKPHFEVSHLVKEAFSLRPEIRRAEKELGVSSFQVNYEKSRLRPSLSLSFSMRRSGTTFWPEERSYSWSVNLNFPLFDSGQSTYRALEKDREREVALLKLKKLKNRIKREVLDVVADIESSYRNLKSDYAFLEFSKKAYDRALNEYKLGVSDIVALMQAFDTLKRAEDRYVSSLLAYNLALLSLKKVIGKLLLEVER